MRIKKYIFEQKGLTFLSHFYRTTYQEVIVHVQDVNIHAPEFIEFPSGPMNIQENGRDDLIVLQLQVIFVFKVLLMSVTFSIFSWVAFKLNVYVDIKKPEVQPNVIFRYFV